MIEQDVLMHDITIQQQELDRLSNQYNEAMMRQDELTKQIEQTEQSIQETEVELEQNTSKLMTQSVYKYKYGEVPFIEIITGSSDFYSFLVNIDFYNRTIEQFNKTIEEGKELKENLTSQRQDLAKQQLELKEEIKQVETAKAEAEQCIEQLRLEYSQLDEEIAVLLIQQQLYAAIDSSLESDMSAEYLTDTIINTGEVNYAEMLINGTVAQEIASKAAQVGINIDANDIVSRAYSMIGSPYSWGGTTSSGFDCSGFVSYCLTGQEGTRLGTTGTFIGWEQVSDPQPGDVCVVHNDTSQHTGIYVGDGKMVHAATYGVGVVEGDVQSGMTYVRYTG